MTLTVWALAERVDFHEWADVQPHAIDQVGVPGVGLLLQRRPPDEDVVGVLAFQDQLTK